MLKIAVYTTIQTKIICTAQKSKKEIAKRVGLQIALEKLALPTSKKNTKVLKIYMGYKHGSSSIVICIQVKLYYMRECGLEGVLSNIGQTMTIASGFVFAFSRQLICSCVQLVSSNWNLQKNQHFKYGGRGWPFPSYKRLWIILITFDHTVVLFTTRPYVYHSILSTARFLTFAVCIATSN